MKDSPRDVASAIDDKRLLQLIETYGAAPHHWPAEERAAAESCLAASPAAQAAQAEALALDRLLDAVTCEPPSAILQAQVMARAPRQRRPAGRQIAWVGLPLAAAAVLLLWLGVGVPTPVAEPALASRSVGEYTLGSDVLLQPFAADVYTTVPAIGCNDSWLACPPESADEPYSQQAESERRTA